MSKNVLSDHLCVSTLSVRSDLIKIANGHNQNYSEKKSRRGSAIEYIQNANIINGGILVFGTSKLKHSTSINVCKRGKNNQHLDSGRLQCWKSISSTSETRLPLDSAKIDRINANQLKTCIGNNTF